jgi:hypothetical protein
MSEEHERATWFNVRFGSNLHKNSGNIIRIKGKNLIKLERGRDNKLLVSVELRGKNGELLAKIRRNAPVYLNKFLTIQRGLKYLKLIDKKSGGILFEMEQMEDETVKINGIFYVEGTAIIATDKGLYLPSGNIISNCTFENNKSDIIIG